MRIFSTVFIFALFGFAIPCLSFAQTDLILAKPSLLSLKKMLRTPSEDCNRKLGALPEVYFVPGSSSLSTAAREALTIVSGRIRNNPECRVVITGYCSSAKAEQQISWDRVNRVITYLIENEGISSDRFIFNYGQEGGDCNSVDVRGALDGEEGPTNVAPPHPNLRRGGGNDPLQRRDFNYHFVVPEKTTIYLIRKEEWKKIFGNTILANFTREKLNQIDHREITVDEDGNWPVWEEKYIVVFISGDKFTLREILPIRKTPAKNLIRVKFP